MALVVIGPRPMTQEADPLAARLGPGLGPVSRTRLPLETEELLLPARRKSLPRSLQSGIGIALFAYDSSGYSHRCPHSCCGKLPCAGSIENAFPPNHRA